MQDSVLSKPPIPSRHNPLPVAGAHLLAFLREAAQQPTPQERKAALQYLFRWFLLLEGKEEARLSPEELRSWRGRFYALLPEALREDFPWDVPEPLPPLSPECPSYPRHHTPFRQYGFIAAKVVDILPLPVPSEMVAVFMQGLMQILRHHGEQVEAETLARHLGDLSGGHLRVPDEVISLVSRVASAGESRVHAPAEATRQGGRPTKGRRFHRRHRR